MKINVLIGHSQLPDIISPIAMAHFSAFLLSARVGQSTPPLTWFSCGHCLFSMNLILSVFHLFPYQLFAIK